MTNLRLSRSQLEKAVAAYLKHKQTVDCGSTLGLSRIPVLIRMGEIKSDGSFKLAEIDEIPTPSICVSCPRAERHPMGYAKCELHVIILGSVDPTELDDVLPIGGAIFEDEYGHDLNLPKLQHETIVGWTAQQLSEELMRDVVSALNPPESGPDLRAIKDFMAFGFLPVDDSSQETERHWIDDFVFDFHCQPTDDTSL